MKTRWMFALLAALAVGSASRACTTEMSVPTLAGHAAQVIIADIQSVRSYWASDPRRIETEITLRNIVYLKGAYDGAPIERTLIVPGGAVGEWGMRLCCAPEYRAGERWVLFVLPTCKVHPVVGMERGSLRIQRDEQGVDRIASADGRAVLGVDAHGTIELAGPIKPRPQGAETSVTRLNSETGVRLVRADHDDPAPVEPEAMTLAAFREAVAPALASSRDHGLRRPAGERVRAEFRAVPLKEAGARESADESTGVTP